MPTAASRRLARRSCQTLGVTKPTTMATPLEVVIAGPTDRLPLYRMLELYQHDLSDIWDQELDAHGEYGYELDRFMRQSNAWAYVFRFSGNLAGFALVDTRVRI